MPITCIIHFDNNKNKFHPGQKIGITVRVMLTEKIEIRNITLQLRGKSHVTLLANYIDRDEPWECYANVLDVEKYLVHGNDGNISLKFLYS